MNCRRVCPLCPSPQLRPAELAACLPLLPGLSRLELAGVQLAADDLDGVCGAGASHLPTSRPLHSARTATHASRPPLLETGGHAARPAPPRLGGVPPPRLRRRRRRRPRALRPPAHARHRERHVHRPDAAGPPLRHRRRGVGHRRRRCAAARAARGRRRGAARRLPVDRGSPFAPGAHTSDSSRPDLGTSSPRSRPLLSPRALCPCRPSSCAAVSVPWLP